MKSGIIIRSPQTAYALVRMGLALCLLGYIQTWGTGLSQAPLALTYGGFSLLVLALPALRHGQRGWHLTLLNLSDAAFLGALSIVQGGMLTLAMLPVLGVAAHAWMGRRYVRNFFYFLSLAAAIGWLSNGWQLAWEQQFVIIATAASLLVYNMGNRLLAPRTSLNRHIQPSQISISKTTEPTEEEPDLLILGSGVHRSEINTLIERWQMHAHGFSDELEFLAETANRLSQGHLQAIIIDLRDSYTDPVRLIDTLQSSALSKGLRCIAILPAGHSADEKLLLQKGYAALLTSPLDSTLLFNALHEQPNTTNVGVSSLFNRYLATRTALPPLEILVASPNPVQLKLIKRLLERNNHHVYSTDKGEQALDAMTAHRFDLALLDDALKDMDSVEIARIYRLTRLSHEATPIGIISNQRHAELNLRAASAGIGAVLEHPVQPARLNAVIQQLINKNKTDQQMGNILLSSSDGMNQNATHAIIDQQTLNELKNLGSGLSFVRELVENFITDSQETAEQMQRALDHQHIDSFRDSAHALKGSAGSVGAVRLQSFCIKLAAISSQDFEGTSSLLMEKLHEELSFAHDGLLDYLNQQESRTSSE